jgi:hypothetical protein
MFGSTLGGGSALTGVGATGREATGTVGETGGVTAGGAVGEGEDDDAATAFTGDVSES